MSWSDAVLAGIKPTTLLKRGDGSRAAANAVAAPKALLIAIPKGFPSRLAMTCMCCEVYLRKQLIHGARAALPYIAERDTPLGRWVKRLMSRTHRNVVVVALANKLARIAWAVLQRGKPFDARAVSVAA